MVTVMLWQSILSSVSFSWLLCFLLFMSSPNFSFIM
jgi:hypothetical protein